MDDELALGRLFTVAAKIAKEEGIAENGYRLIMNCNEHSGQEVFSYPHASSGWSPISRYWRNNKGSAMNRIALLALVTVLLSGLHI